MNLLNKKYASVSTVRKRFTLPKFMELVAKINDHDPDECIISPEAVIDLTATNNQKHPPTEYRSFIRYLNEHQDNLLIMEVEAMFSRNAMLLLSRLKREERANETN